MLVRLFGSNFRSLKGPFELSMVAADLRRSDDRDRGTISVPIRGASEPLLLLRCVAIYGANASGKSTVLTAGRALNWLVTNSSRLSRPDGSIPCYEPFALDEASSASEVELGCDTIYKDSVIRYTINFKRDVIVNETLIMMNDEGEARLIDRKPSGEVAGKLFSKGSANRLYVKEMQPNVAVLSKLAQHGPNKGKDSVRPYYRAIGAATRYEDYYDAAETQVKLGQGDDERFADDSEYRDWIMSHLIRTADIGICDVGTRRESLKIPDGVREQFAKTSGGMKIPDTRVVVAFVHQGKSSRPIEFSDESSGTRKLYNIAGDWWRLANEPVTLLADELSASLHPRLLDGLIRAVNDAPADRRSQLIFATHDTGLLESRDGLPPALRRDQVYFTKKDDEGASELYALAEFKEDARPVHNIRKRYLSGLYGALPSVEKLSL